MEKLEAAKGYGIEYAEANAEQSRVNLRKHGQIFSALLARAHEYDAEIPPRYQDRLIAEFGEVSDEMRKAFWTGCKSAA